MRLVALLVSCSFIFGCEGTGLGLDGRTISDEEEIAIGEEVHIELQKEYQLFTDTDVTAYVTALGQEIASISERPELPHHFYVLDTDMVNAFAAPGGYVYVTTGLMRNMSSRAELAGVMGHEVGHVSGRHGARTMEAAGLAEELANVLGGGTLGSVVKIAMTGYLQTAHSRAMEREADIYAVDYSHKAGYQPWEFVGFFNFLDELMYPDGNDDYTGGISSYLSSHPEPKERIDNTSLDITGRNIAKDDSSLVVDNSNAPFGMSYSQVQGLLPPEKVEENNDGI